jgi:hypothetical protein
MRINILRLNRMILKFLSNNYFIPLTLPALVIINNNQEVVTLNDIYVISIVVLILFFLIFFVRFFKFCNQYRLDNFLSIAITLNIATNYLYYNNSLVKFYQFCILNVAIFGVYFFLFKKYNVILNKLCSFINITILFFLFITVLNFSSESGYEEKLKSKENYFKNIKLKNTPDIYHIIPDGLMNIAELKRNKFYQHNNFEKTLEENGLQILVSRSNYPTTFTSIPSILNGSLFPEDIKIVEKQFYNLSQNSNFVNMLLENSYKIYWFENTWAGTKCINTRFICPQKKIINTFFDSEIVFNYLKIININYDWNEKILKIFNIKKRFYLDEIQDTMQNVYNKKNSEDPRYIFAHLLIPHQPIKVDEECTPNYLTGKNNTYNEESYFISLECLKKQIITFYNFAKKQKRPFIFIIGSDTGWIFDDAKNPTVNLKLDTFPEEQYYNMIIVNKEIVCFDKKRIVTNVELLPFLIACSEKRDLPRIDNRSFDVFYNDGHDGRKRNVFNKR